MEIPGKAQIPDPIIRLNEELVYHLRDTRKQNKIFK